MSERKRASISGRLPSLSAGLAASLWLTACYNPSFDGNGRFLCGDPEHRCPEGLTCDRAAKPPVCVSGEVKRDAAVIDSARTEAAPADGPITADQGPVAICSMLPDGVGEIANATPEGTFGADADPSGLWVSYTTIAGLVRVVRIGGDEPFAWQGPETTAPHSALVVEAGRWAVAFPGMVNDANPGLRVAGLARVGDETPVIYDLLPGVEIGQVALGLHAEANELHLVYQRLNPNGIWGVVLDHASLDIRADPVAFPTTDGATDLGHSLRLAIGRDGSNAAVHAAYYGRLGEDIVGLFRATRALGRNEWTTIGRDESRDIDPGIGIGMFADPTPVIVAPARSTDGAQVLRRYYQGQADLQLGDDPIVNAAHPALAPNADGWIGLGFTLEGRAHFTLLQRDATTAEFPPLVLPEERVNALVALPAGNNPLRFALISRVPAGQNATLVAHLVQCDPSLAGPRPASGNE